MSEKLLRALFVPSQVYAKDLTCTPPVVYELVGINGVECIRRYYVTSTLTDIPLERLGAFRKRADVVRRWRRLTGERLGNDLKPLADRRVS